MRLYTLIWNRFVASQMAAAVFDTMSVRLGQNGIVFAANGSQVKFDGYMAVYNDADKNKMLPDMEQGDTVVARQQIQNNTLLSHQLATLKQP